MMKNLKTISLIFIAVLAGLLLYNCTGSSGQTGNENDMEPTLVPDSDNSTGLANPASVYCEKQGGTVEIRTGEDGGQYGVCIFEDGSECEEWSFFRGECQPGQSGDSLSTTNLSNITWVLESYNQPLLSDTTITIEFNNDGQVNGSAGCNSYFGSYDLAGDKLITGPIGSTEMWCEGLIDQESAFLQALQSATGLTVTENSLTIHTPDGDMQFAPAQNATLEGTDWVLSGIAQDDAVTSTSIDADITIKFADGQVSGDSGCNSYSGGYQIDGSNLTLSALASTLMACAEPERNQRESEFLSALNTVTRFRTDMNQLILSNDAGQDVLFFTASGS